MREQKIELREIETDYSTGSEYDASGSKQQQTGQGKSWPRSLDDDIAVRQTCINEEGYAGTMRSRSFDNAAGSNGDANQQCKTRKFLKTSSSF